MPDFSSNNGTVNLDEVWRAGVRAILLKATEGTTYPWTAAAGLAAHWHKLGGIVGHYHFMHPGGTAEAYAEADFFVAHVKPLLGVGSFVVVDHETKGETNAEVGAFIDRVHAHLPHTPGMQYAYEAFFGEAGIRRHLGWGLMVASYGPGVPPVPRDWSAWTAWQFTRTGGLPGVNGHVDLSHIKPSLIQPALYAGNRSWAVLEMKQRLRKAGYRGFVASEGYGPGMVRAVLRFKRDRPRVFGAHPSGKVAGAAVWARLP